MEKRLLICLAIDVLLWSSAAAGGNIRLVGLTSCSGRVEIFHNNSWGTVCDDGWGMAEAEVACRQARCGRALGANKSTSFGPGTGQIWLDNVVCAGNEISLAGCQYAGFGKHDCGHKPSRTMIYIVSAGVSGLVLLVLLVVVFLVCRGKRVRRPEAFCPTQMTVTHSFDAGQENNDDDDDNVSYENVELMDGQMKGSEENHDQDEEYFVEAMDFGDDSAHNQERSDDENDYENVLAPCEQQTMWTEQEIYENI